ncbi:MAG: translation initiation factor IF-2 subunit beta [Thermoplasmata archaeon]|nr:translation initiation factor IF-2 subunit beta [Thermoplasmata archaeon]
MSDYEKLLARAKEKLPHETEVHERLKIPEPEVMIEGKTTVIRNLADIADALRREPQHIFGYLLRELGTAGALEGKRALLKGNVPTSQISDRLERYIIEYVTCSECDRPDTRIVKDGRVQILVCETCGAHRPVKVRKAAKQESKGLKEGEVYELQIEDIGKRGDGIARNGDYIIYVPGTTKGVQVKVKIVKISGRTAFGTVVA